MATTLIPTGSGSGNASDKSGVPVIGAAGSEVTLAAGAGAFTAQSTLTDVSGHKQCTWYVIIASRDVATTQINVRIDWTADGGSLFSTQGTESISSGASTLSLYEAQYDVTGLTGPFSLPPISLPVVAPQVRVRVGADAGSTTAYVLVARQA